MYRVKYWIGGNIDDAKVTLECYSPAGAALAVRDYQTRGFNAQVVAA